MNSRLTIITILAGAGALTLGFHRLPAQATSSPEAGLIGRRQAGFDFAYERYDGGVFDYTFGISPSVNLPLNRKFDLSVGYDLSHTTESDHVLNHNALRATILTCQRGEYGNAYFSGTLIQNWDRVKTFGVLARDHDIGWACSTGYEIPLGTVTAVNAGLTYRDAFRGHHTTLQYRLEANHWFTRDFAGAVSASYNQITKAPDSLLYTLGVRWAMH